MNGTVNIFFLTLMAPHSQARRVGCRPPWDSWSPQDIQLCQTVEQLQQHENLDWLDINYEQKMIINNTGCKVPCSYKVCTSGVHISQSSQLSVSRSTRRQESHRAARPPPS